MKKYIKKQTKSNQIKNQNKIKKKKLKDKDNSLGIKTLDLTMKLNSFHCTTTVLLEIPESSSFGLLPIGYSEPNKSKISCHIKTRI